MTIEIIGNAINAASEDERIITISLPGGRAASFGGGAAVGPGTRGAAVGPGTDRPAVMTNAEIGSILFLVHGVLTRVDTGPMISDGRLQRPNPTSISDKVTIRLPITPGYLSAFLYPYVRSNAVRLRIDSVPTVIDEITNRARAAADRAVSTGERVVDRVADAAERVAEEGSEAARDVAGAATTGAAAFGAFQLVLAIIAIGVILYMWRKGLL